MKIVVDPGHGGIDAGAKWKEKYGCREENDLNLSISYYLKYELDLLNHKVTLSRYNDIYVGLKERTLLADKFDADIFISIHADAWHNTNEDGISTHKYGSGERTKLLANIIHSQLTHKFPDHTNRGIKSSEFYVLQNTRMPSVLIKCGPITYPKEKKFFNAVINQVLLAKAIASGVKSYIKSTYREDALQRTIYRWVWHNWLHRF